MRLSSLCVRSSLRFVWHGVKSFERSLVSCSIVGASWRFGKYSINISDSGYCNGEIFRWSTATSLCGVSSSIACSSGFHTPMLKKNVLLHTYFRVFQGKGWPIAPRRRIGGAIWGSLLYRGQQVSRCRYCC